MSSGSSRIVILSGARTPIGKLSGVLASFEAVQLGGFAIAEALERAELAPERVDYVYMGHVLQAGAGHVPARQAAVNGGISMSVPASTVNKVCLSGMDAIYQADRMVRAGDARTVVAGGMESMTNAAYLLPGARSGYRIGEPDGRLDDVRRAVLCLRPVRDGGGYREVRPGPRGVPDRQDAFAAESHRRADAAQRAGLFQGEIVPVTVPKRKGDALVVARDEGVRGETTIESLSSLRPAFDREGHITAGNASQISDGASAVVVTTLEVAEELGVTPLAEILGYGKVAGPDASLLHQPSRAINAALARLDMSVAEVDLFEINEAFAAVGIASMDDLGIGPDVVNVNGGAIAIGHPLGMSGNRITLHLALELARRGGGTGAAALCGGGGQGDAMVIRTLR